ncbi:GNAT family acetyltransferase-like protein [Pyrenochaeta sp. MPI-SDFR-AT-0127]|nr:GNAT family acetyltransferase-like protein [Pyrenochaeta sp. MPI-SDFR-AT-0127]
MDPLLFTPRLKLTLVENAERGSPELTWLHEMRSNAQATFWSILGQAKTLEDTEKYARMCLDTEEENGKSNSYRMLYAVHEILSSASAPNNNANNTDDSRHPNTSPSRFVGLINIKPIGGPNDLEIPAAHIDPTTLNPSTLVLEIGYQFLPVSWGKGYATESISAIFDALKRAAQPSTNESSYWLPYQNLYVRAIVNEENPASLRVMAKTGMQKTGIWEWTGEAVWLAGRWIDKSKIHIFGKYLIQ